jgi:hypothetical protein
MHTEDPAIRARRRAEAKLGFYKHLATYLVINILLFLINFFASPDSFWAIWPLLGWGIAVAFHALSVFVFSRDDKILDRLTEAEMHRDQSGLN